VRVEERGSARGRRPSPALPLLRGQSDPRIDHADRRRVREEHVRDPVRGVARQLDDVLDVGGHGGVAEEESPGRSCAGARVGDVDGQAAAEQGYVPARVG
jgi:hypothetical protein